MTATEDLEDLEDAEGSRTTRLGASGAFGSGGVEEGVAIAGVPPNSAGGTEEAGSLSLPRPTTEPRVGLGGLVVRGGITGICEGLGMWDEGFCICLSLYARPYEYT